MSYRASDKETDDYDYSDDSFDSEDEKPARRTQSLNRARKTTEEVYLGKKASPKKDDSRGKGRGKGRGKQRSTSQVTPRVDPVVQRVLSARKLRINELRNNMEDLVKQIEDLREENKLLKKTQYRQEKALNRFDERESDLPQIMQRHNNETRTMREQLKKTKDKYDRTDRYLRDAEDELEKVKNKVKKYKRLVDENDLMERDDLQTKVKKAEIDIEEKEVKIKDLERHVTHLSKNHRHELGIEMARTRDTKKQMETLREENERLERQLKEKVKELEMKNIYANRMSKPGSRMMPNSYSGTPMRQQSPSSPRRRRPPSVHDLNPREKVKLYEERRKEEERKQRESASPIPRLRFSRESKEYEKGDDSPTSEQQQKVLEEKDARERGRKFQQEQEEEFKRKERWEHMERVRLDQEEREQEEREKQERRRRDREGQEQREREEKDRREAEEWKMKLEREQMKREAEELKREQEDRQRRERERKEQERRAEEERERIQRDQQMDEERRKKDSLLAKLRDIDDGKKTKREESHDPVFLTNKTDSDVESITSSKKSYQFTKPVENLHHGKWSHEDVTIPYLEKQKKKKEKDDDVGAYQPSFGRRGDTKKTGKKTGGDVVFNDDFAKPPKHRENKKKNLMADLFGNQPTTNTSNNNDEDIFNSTNFDKKKTNTAKLSLFDDEPKQTTTKRENSLSLFGGGSALLDDDDTTKTKDSSKLLPRRQRHSTTTFQSRPMVTAVDNYDDDIEEVIL
ncbi:lebercilin-like isoform X5 [Mizuhopecten yessoensis]|uniref:lebercilin-like isoform X5 n=1 Tax=Mizuhopecten yessoensis TaxID=6573 RepID=UPI000B45D77A|nr:lebercilin-like isoform X5 [Mizuhopecten yessoensis]